MKKAYMKYNPYTVQTEIKLEGEPLSRQSPMLPYLEGHRLQEWLEPCGDRKGLFAELRSALNSEELELTFHGTALDYRDVEEVSKTEGKKYFKEITLKHENEESAKEISPEKKLEGLRKIYGEIKCGPVPEFHTPEIDAAFETAINDSFEIFVIAPMSSGKSTLINAVMGCDLLPAFNQATTAVITRIRDVDGKKDFTVSAKDCNGRMRINNEPATAKKLEEVNNAKDPQDPAGRRSLYSEIFLDGDIASLPANGLHTVFVDTPGGNNSLNKQHEDVMNRAIQDENKSIVIFVFNATQLSTNDSERILQKIAQAMKRGENGKQSRDRFLFVANEMDMVDTAKESYESMRENILETLRTLKDEDNQGIGIADPNLFFVSAQTAKLKRMKDNQIEMTENDEENWSNLCKKMTRDSRNLFDFSSLTQTQKEYFRKKVESLKEQQPDVKGNPAIAEINSGVPALELAISTYLQKYALAIKLKQMQDTFTGKINDEVIIGNAQRRWNESEEAFKKAQADAIHLKERLENDKTMQEALAVIEAIELTKKDENDIREKATGFTMKIQDLAGKYRGKTEMSKDEAKKAKEKFEKDADATISEVNAEINELLRREIGEKCNTALKAYHDQWEKLKEEGLLDIGGIEIAQLSSAAEIKKIQQSNIGEYCHTRTVYISKEDQGFFGGVARFFGGMFNREDWGYHTERETETYVDMKELTENAAGSIFSDTLDTVKKNIERGRKDIEDAKAKATKQVRTLKEIIQKVADDYEKKTQSRDALTKANEDSKKTYEFSVATIQKIKGLLEI